jgi:hypothetical protein
LIEEKIEVKINETEEYSNEEEEGIGGAPPEIDQDAIAENDNISMIFDSNPILLQNDISETKNEEEEAFDEFFSKEGQIQDESPDSPVQDEIKEEDIIYENATKFSIHICIEMISLFKIPSDRRKRFLNVLTAFSQKLFKSLKMLMKMNNL